jgi:hypothetical protein
MGLATIYAIFLRDDLLQRSKVAVSKSFSAIAKTSLNPSTAKRKREGPNPKGLGR